MEKDRKMNESKEKKIRRWFSVKRYSLIPAKGAKSYSNNSKNHCAAFRQIGIF